jgi:hypothetical protein
MARGLRSEESLEIRPPYPSFPSFDSLGLFFPQSKTIKTIKGNQVPSDFHMRNISQTKQFGTALLKKLGACQFDEVLNPDLW